MRAATAIASAAAGLPVTGQALADGTVSREHLDVAVSTMARIPKALKTKPIEQPTTDQAGATTHPTERSDEVHDHLTHLRIVQ